jgi:hypothetical protein
MRWLPLLLLFACGSEGPPFDLEIRADEFGSDFTARVGIVQSDGVVLLRESFPVQDGTFEVTWGDVFAEGGTYQVFLMFDLDENGVCDFNDQTFVADVGPVDALVQLDVSDLGTTATACQFFL